MSVDLYYYPVSFYSQKVRLALEEKKIPYNKVLINLPKGETRTPHYMTHVHRNGQVPVIKHEGNFLADSNEIIKYLDFKFNGRMLFPAGGTAEGKHTEEFMARHAAQCHIPVLTFGAACNPELCDGLQLPEYMRKSSKAQMTGGGMEKEMHENMEKNPDLKPAYEKKMEGLKLFSRQVVDKECVKEKIEECKKFFDFIEVTLRQNAEGGKADFFLYSEDFNIADITLTVTLERLRILGLLKPVILDGNHPYVAKYHERVLRRPTVQTAVVGGYSKGALMRASIYFKWRDMNKSLLFVAAVGVIGYFAWQYSRNM